MTFIVNILQLGDTDSVMAIGLCSNVVRFCSFCNGATWRAGRSRKSRGFRVFVNSVCVLLCIMVSKTVK